MKVANAAYSLRSEFRLKATPERIRARMAVKDAADKRTQENRKAIGSWHNEVRAKLGRQDVPFPIRRTN
jgi:hypothetical protein